MAYTCSTVIRTYGVFPLSGLGEPHSHAVTAFFDLAFTLLVRWVPGCRKDGLCSGGGVKTDEAISNTVSCSAGLLVGSGIAEKMLALYS